MGLRPWGFRTTVSASSFFESSQRRSGDLPRFSEERIENHGGLIAERGVSSGTHESVNGATNHGENFPGLQHDCARSAFRDSWNSRRILQLPARTPSQPKAFSWRVARQQGTESETFCGLTSVLPPHTVDYTPRHTHQSPKGQ